MKEDNPSLSEEWIMQKITALVSDLEEQDLLIYILNLFFFLYMLPNFLKCSAIN